MESDYIEESALPLMLTPKMVAGLLGLSVSFTRELFRRSDFPCALIGKRRLISRPDFLDWLEDQEMHRSDR